MVDGSVLTNRIWKKINQSLKTYYKVLCKQKYIKMFCKIFSFPIWDDFYFLLFLKTTIWSTREVCVNFSVSFEFLLIYIKLRAYILVDSQI